jgi:DNA-binding NtrC family response regulator
MSGAKILLVDDDPAVLRAVSGILEDAGHRPVKAKGAQEARAALAVTRDPPALMVLDLRMPGEGGLALLSSLPRPLPLPVVVLSGEASVSEAVQALKLGALDFVEKPPSAERLLTAVKNALALSELSEERERLREELAKPGHLIGESAAMEGLRRLIAKVGPSDAVVLIRGETGTGKERVARALHLASGRKGRFVAVNCAAIPSTLLESELFGYERGAFSGATHRKLGRIEQAQGGTVLLDEIGDMPLELQAKLLRVLEQREVERLGGERAVPIDVRFLAATHRDLKAALAEGKFREDLFFRLSVFPMEVPPLRERPDDILPLMRAFAVELAGPRADVRCTGEAEAGLRGAAWRGNVRELRNFVERQLLLGNGQELVIDEDAVAALSGRAPAATGSPSLLGEKSYRELVEGYERSLLSQALARSGENIAAAARLLRMDRGNLYRRLQALGIAPEDSAEPT